MKIDTNIYTCMDDLLNTPCNTRGSFTLVLCKGENGNKDWLFDFTKKCGIHEGKCTRACLIVWEVYW